MLLKFYFFLTEQEKRPIKDSVTSVFPPRQTLGRRNPLHYIQIIFATQKDVNNYFSWALQKPIEPLEKH